MGYKYHCLGGGTGTQQQHRGSGKPAQLTGSACGWGTWQESPGVGLGAGALHNGRAPSMPGNGNSRWQGVGNAGVQAQIGQVAGNCPGQLNSCHLGWGITNAPTFSFSCNSNQGLKNKAQGQLGKPQSMSHLHCQWGRNNNKSASGKLGPVRGFNHHHHQPSCLLGFFTQWGNGEYWVGTITPGQRPAGVLGCNVRPVMPQIVWAQGMLGEFNARPKSPPGQAGWGSNGVGPQWARRG